MKERKPDTRRLVMAAMLCGILIVMETSGIGFVQLGAFKVTTMHIPVILGAVLMGWKTGLGLGAVFGLCSVWTNSTKPGPTSFMFSPFLADDAAGAFKAIWIALGCRILFGLIAGLIWKGLKKTRLNDFIALPVCAVTSTLTHTILVLSSIYLLMQTEPISVGGLFYYILGVVASNGIFEMLLAAVLVTAIGKALMPVVARMKKR